MIGFKPEKESRHRVFSYHLLREPDEKARLDDGVGEMIAGPDVPGRVGAIASAADFLAFVTLAAILEARRHVGVANLPG